MATFIGDLEISRPAAHVRRVDLLTPPAWLTGHKPAHRRLTGEREPSEREAALSSPGWVDWEPERRCSKAVSPSAGPLTVFLPGELDVATAVVGRLQLRRGLETGRGPLFIDCSAVRFIDAAWLGVLVSTARYGAQLGRKVIVAEPSPRVLRALRLVGLQWLLGEE
jgi:anti-anti-sigma factor